MPAEPKDASFPLAYSVVLNALYMPLMLMLLGLLFRGVAFEFRFKASDRRRHIWDKAFIWGSLVSTFFQGVTFGAYIDGIPMTAGQYSGGAMDWLSPFPLFTGVGVVVAYAFLGSTWLIMKTEAALQWKMIQLARVLTFVMLAMIVGISIWIPLAHAEIAERWFSLP